MNKNDADKLDSWVDDILARRAPGNEWQPNVARALVQFQLRTTAKRPRGRTWAWAIAGALAASASVVAFPAGRAFAQRCVSTCVADSGKVWQYFNGDVTHPAPKNVFVNPGDRAVAPDFTLSDASGRAVTLSDFRGQVVLLNFWATWCIPCGAEIPSLMELQDAYRARGFQVLGVSVDEDGWKSVKPFIEARHVNYPVIIGNDALQHAYGGLESVPMTLIIDKSGRIAATHVGLCRKAEYEADIQAVLKE